MSRIAIRCLDERGEWCGVADMYDEERIIPGWMVCFEDGRVYWSPDGENIPDYPPVDEGQPFEEWERMVGNPFYPSAKFI